MVARLKTPASEQQIDEIRRLLELGVPKVRVAKQCGISIRTLYRHLSTLTSKPDSVSGKFSMQVHTPSSGRTNTDREKRRKELSELVSDNLAALQPPSKDD